MLNDLKGFCYLDLKCSVMFCFTLNFHRMYLNLYETFVLTFTSDLGRHLRYACHRKMHEMRFPNIDISSNVIYYIHPLTITPSIFIHQLYQRLNDIF